MSKNQSRTGSIVRIALTIAIMAVSAWVTIPLGPVPFTLQCFAIAFAICVLPPKECLAAIGGYLVLGAFGVPVFSSMRGGVAVLAGVTGGFIWGWLLGAIAALGLLAAFKKMGQNRTLVACFCSCLAYLLFTYACGTIQFMAVTGATLEAALAACVIPFVAVDLAKLAAAAVVARAVDRAVGINRIQGLAHK